MLGAYSTPKFKYQPHIWSKFQPIAFRSKKEDIFDSDFGVGLLKTPLLGQLECMSGYRGQLLAHVTGPENFYLEFLCISGPLNKPGPSERKFNKIK